MKPLDEELSRQHAEQSDEAGADAAAPGGDGVEESAAPEQAVEHDLEELLQKARERDEFLSLLQRARADFANYQQRVARQIEEEKKYALVPFVRELAGVVDDLERAIEAAESASNAQAILEGLRLVYRQLLNVLSHFGVQQIVPDGETFDPKYHEAMQEEERTDVPPGKVVRTLQKGYLLHDRLVRPAKVIVSRAPAGSSSEDSTATGES